MPKTTSKKKTSAAKQTVKKTKSVAAGKSKVTKKRASAPAKQIMKAKASSAPSATKPQLTKNIPPPSIAPPMTKRERFNQGDAVVYPPHGVGRVLGLETHQIAGTEVTLYAIEFPEERMTLRVPLEKAEKAGLRRLSSKDRLKTALETLKGKSRIRRIMWSRRAQEYEAKIKSGDPVAIAEVVRDLYRGTNQPEQSYSERQIYQFALERLAREVAAVEKIDETTAIQNLEEQLGKVAA